MHYLGCLIDVLLKQSGGIGFYVMNKNYIISVII